MRMLALVCSAHPHTSSHSSCIRMVRGYGVRCAVKIVSNNFARSSHGDVRYNHVESTMMHLPAYLSPNQTARYRS